MVTATTDRIPHPVQAGAAPTAIWLTLRLISLAVAVVPILLLPPAGRHLTRQNGVLFPDGGLLLGVLMAYAALIGFWIARRLLTSALTFRTPGQMRVVGPGDAPIQTTRTPGVIALIVLVVAEAAAALYAATHAQGDHGVTALVLTLGGVYFAGRFIARTLRGLVGRRPGWQADLGEDALRYAPSAVVMFGAGCFVAPRGELTEPGVATAFGMILLITVVLLWGFRRATRARGGVVSGVAEDLADGVLSRTNAAPTLKDRQRGAQTVRRGLYAAAIIAAVAWLAIAFL